MWLLEAQTLKQISTATASGLQPTAEQQAEITARFGTDQDGSLRIMSVAGGTARIDVVGTLTNSPNWMAHYFGGGNTIYPEIIKALALAEQDSSVDNIEMYFDSPGGSVAGLFDAVAAMQQSSKKIIARVGNQAASAAYILASQADEIVAMNRASSVGSFGVVIDAAFSADTKLVSITNTESPNKRPDIETDEGQAVIREHLDAIFELFGESVASARGVSVEKMNKDFGRGSMLLAEEAVKRGMIDRVDGVASLSVVSHTLAAKSGVDEPEASKMDLNKLKSEHSDVYAAAVQVGVKEENERVSAHLTMGEASGDMKTAITAINDGSALTAKLQATYMAAGMNRSDISARAQESAAAAAAAAAAASDTPASGELSAADQVAALVEAQMGVSA